LEIFVHLLSINQSVGLTGATSLEIAGVVLAIAEGILLGVAEVGAAPILFSACSIGLKSKPSARKAL
jgi:hypothetical protein